MGPHKHKVRSALVCLWPWTGRLLTLLAAETVCAVEGPEIREGSWPQKVAWFQGLSKCLPLGRRGTWRVWADIMSCFSTCISGILVLRPSAVGKSMDSQGNWRYHPNARIQVHYREAVSVSMPNLLVLHRLSALVLQRRIPLIPAGNSHEHGAKSRVSSKKRK
jgi:hypothetical protein